MSRGVKWARQRIIDDYLKRTRRQVFVPREFLSWLAQKPDHECYDLFFGVSDAEAAARYREDMVRKWVAGLRVTIAVPETQTVRINGVRVTEVEVPGMVSPAGAWKAGGGYLRYEAAPEEVQAEAARALDAWLERYSGALGLAGFDLSAIEEIAGLLKARVSEAA
jgi:hypothetical protein